MAAHRYQECMGDVAIPPTSGPPRRQGDLAIYDFVRSSGDPQALGNLGYGEAKVDEATFNFVPSFGDPSERRGDAAIPKGGVMWRLWGFSSLLGTPKKAWVR